METLAPGARIVARDAEWLVKATSRTPNGSVVIEVVGVSDFIKGRTARFVKELEEDLEVLDPKNTNLVSDNTPGYRNSLLFLEAHLRQTAPTDTNFYIGHEAAMDVLPYQLDPTLKALSMPRQRLLIADAVGLGKTLEAGILVAELMRRGRAKRILVVTTKSMLTQFQKEFWVRFTIPLVRLDSVGIQRIRSRIPTNHNPFHYYDKAIVSVDTLKQDREYRTYIEQAEWDVIVIDEAHNVARRGRGSSASLRSKLADRLASRSDSLIMLSATPHDGRAESFASLMNMLDPTAIANESNYTKEDIRDLYVRRFKKDVVAQLLKKFPERQVLAVEANASPQEEKAFEILDNLKLAGIDAKASTGKLFKTTLLKAMLSSPMACLETVCNRINRVEKTDDRRFSNDIDELKALAAALVTINDKNFSKYQKLLKLITTAEDEGFAWKGADPKDRIVIFTERLETMRFLKENLKRDLQLTEEAIATLDGGMPDVELMEIIEEFGSEKSPLRLVVATDVASEGINLHYFSHRLIHFDIPWSLMALQQRNGRVDRYGQERQPQIRYLLTRSSNEKVDEAERIVSVLVKKDDQAIKNIGDPSVFMGVFDADKEVEVTAAAIEAIEQGETEQTFDARLQPGEQTEDEDNWFADLLSDEPEVSEEPQAQAAMQKMPSLFPDDYHYTLEALKAVNEENPLQLRSLEEELLIELTMPNELRSRFERLPREIQPASNQALRLSGDRNKVMRELEESRKSEERWPSIQYLWELHPVVDWLNDRGITLFGRHQAPVIVLPQLQKNEVIFVMSGIIPNRRGQPLVNKWVSVVFQNQKFKHIEDFEKTLQLTGLGQEPIPNQMLPIDEKLLDLREIAVVEAQKKMLKARNNFEDSINVQLQEQLNRLNKLKGQHYEQLTLRFADGTPLKEEKKSKAERRIEQIFNDYWRWVEDSMTTEPAPYIKIIAVLQGAKV
ncbi:DEAD/DEAH box helicase [Nostoc parmelioides]|uniref:DEAD/DEAH box helicase n=1 Tax=Nostoc parmelioides FACHB-3921 TaxID=2692909 RepID=A0ABR8BMV9_9NOSO|nr:DEAD/DEAH box helicase [Nostoc parmelioides]MBD2255004.1 DEAD/DEAH box helicase [Nostoc parmelioides FACHB-3921]